MKRRKGYIIATTVAAVMLIVIILTMKDSALGNQNTNEVQTQNVLVSNSVQNAIVKSPPIAVEKPAVKSDLKKMEWFVAPEGDDAGSGDSEHPFATLERARAAVRAARSLRRKEERPPVETTVWLTEGTFQLEKTFHLDKADSGVEGAEVVYRAVEGAKVYISSGQETLGWKRVKSLKLLARIDPIARGKVLQTNLKKLGISDFGTVDKFPLELFMDGRPMTLARWPNDGWAQIGKLPDGKEGLRFELDDKRLSRWATAKEAWVYGYWFHKWSEEHLPVAEFKVEENEILLSKKHRYGLRIGSRFRVENLLEELDTPGEWFLDRTSGDLFFWPPKIQSGLRPVISTLKTPLVRLNNAAYISFYGIIFGESRGTAVEIKGGKNCQLIACSIRNAGAHGVVINQGDAHRVIACEVQETGSSAIRISGGDRQTLVPGKHEVLDCNLHHYARRNRTYQPGVHVSGVGHRVAHNHIHHAPHIAVFFSGNDHRLEYNEIHHVCQETDDAGAFYIGRNWTDRGHLVLHNHFHNIGNEMLGTYGAHHVYLDDLTSGVTVRGNIFEQGNRVILIGGGRDNVVEHNLFIEPALAIHVDDRGLNWSDKTSEGGSWGIYRKLRAVPFDTPPYSTRYPNLATILENNPPVPLGNRIEYNIIAGGTPYNFKLKDQSVLQLKNNWIGEDPGFVDATRRDFRLRPDSPARKIGFKEIPFDKIGPRTN